MRQFLLFIVKLSLIVIDPFTHLRVDKITPWFKLLVIIGFIYLNEVFGDWLGHQA